GRKSGGTHGQQECAARKFHEAPSKECTGHIVHRPAGDNQGMDDTLRLIQDSLRKFIEKEVLPHGHKWEEQGFVPREVLRAMGKLGFLGLRYPEEYGGGALDTRATALLAEELGRSTFSGFAITVLVHTDMASPHLVNAGSPEQIRKYLPKIVSGELITAVAVT